MTRASPPQMKGPPKALPVSEVARVCSSMHGMATQ